MSTEDNVPASSEIDDLAELEAKFPKHPDNKWEARADAAAAGEPVEEAPADADVEADEEAVDEPTAESAETLAEVPATDEASTSRAREAMAAKNSRAREALAAKGVGDPTQPPPLLTATVSIVSYVIGVLLGWGAGSWMDADPWPIAFAGVIGGVVGFLLGRAVLRGVYALRG